MPTLKNIDAKEAARVIREQAPYILDVRTTGEYQSGHLASSVLIPVQDLESRISEMTQDHERAILVYCRSGNRSVAAGDFLIRRGYKNVYNLLGGIGSWERSGEPVLK
jgi:rhodanese-related sulfurtransferase